MSGKEYQDGLESLKYGRQHKVLTERGSPEGHEVSLRVRKSKYSRREGVDFFSGAFGVISLSLQSCRFSLGSES
jgi:hypothetical protein